MAGENYIGSKISLISLSDIRYVGILHSINAQDSTVGLKQVRSFGTEGRRGKPEEEILPSDNVFDYVVFRGSDIKDLQVFEAPPKPTPPPPPPSMPQDPAIMSMNAYPPPMNHTYMNNNMYMQPPVSQVPVQPPKQQPLSRPPVTSQTSNPTTPMSNSSSNNNNAANNNNNYWQPSAVPAFAADRDLDQARLEKETLDELRAELEESDALQPSINEAAIEQLAKKVSELNPNEDTIISSKPIDDQQQQQQQSRRRYESHNQNNNYRNHRGGRFNHPNNQKAKHDLAIPSSEFDFEASNAKFDKSEIVKKDDGEHEHKEIEIPKPDEFYNKTSSFFDNISCESKERIEQQQEQQQEQQHHH
ncbi:Protein sum2, partial [Choanephora cucurbitarum]